VRGSASAMPNVLVTMPFSEGQLNRLRAVSSDLHVTCADAEKADYSTTEILYAGMPLRDLGRVPRLKWVQLHMAGVNALYDHPIYKDTPIVLTTTSGVHGPTIAEYAITMLLALAHRVPRMVE
jgi:phosphoglycerate dehydrogenase-like enzyme